MMSIETDKIFEENTDRISGKEIKTPFVLTICSGKGGVGKSVLTTNLAHALAQKNYKVLVWDADTQFPNQHLLMGVEPPVRLNDVYLGNVLPETAMFRIKDNLRLLAGLPASGGHEQYDEMILIDTFKNIISETDLDVILIDTPAGDSDEVLQCCSFSDMINVVITDEPTSLLDAYGLIKILMQFIDLDKLSLLVNNVIDWEDADEISGKLNLATKNFLDLEFNVVGFVPYDRSVRQSILYQEPFYNSFPESETTKAVNKITEKLIDRLKEYFSSFEENE